MLTTRFILLGRSQRAVAEARVARVAENWQREWQPVKAALAVRSELPEQWAPERAAKDGAVWQIVRADEERWIAAGMTADVVGALGAVFCDDPLYRPISSKDAPALLGTIAARATGELCTSLLADAGAVGASPPVPATPVPESSWRRGSGALVFELAFGPSKFVLMASAALVAMWTGERKQTSRTNLTPRGLSVDGEPVGIVAFAGEASIPLGDLDTLAVGDVVRLNTRVADGIQLALESGAVLARGMLGASTGHKAIQITL